MFKLYYILTYDEVSSRGKSAVTLELTLISKCTGRVVL